MRRKDPYSGAIEQLARIEAELRRVGGWQDEPPPPEAFNSRQAFFADTMSFYQWLQFVLLRRVREIVEARGEFPRQSQVGIYAIRELDGVEDASDLATILCEFDAFIESWAEADEEDPTSIVDGFFYAVRHRDEDVARRFTTRSSLLFREYGNSRREVRTVEHKVASVDQDDGGFNVRCNLSIHFEDGGFEERFVILRIVEERKEWKVDLNGTYEHTIGDLLERLRQGIRKARIARAERNRGALQRRLEESVPLARHAAEGLQGLGLEPDWLAAVVSEPGRGPVPEKDSDVEPEPAREADEDSIDEPGSPSAELLKRRVTEYWTFRMSGAHTAFETREPWRKTGMDTGLAERVIGSAIAFRQIRGEFAPCEEGYAVDAVIEAERGAWVVRTVLRRERGSWLADPELTCQYTMNAFLRQHHIHPPYTSEESPRGRAMQFWHRVSCNDERRARPLLTPETRGMEIPRKGQGHIDEFFWFIDEVEQPGGVLVRVLMNVREEQRMWNTCMVERDGQWLVDLAATLSLSSD